MKAVKVLREKYKTWEGASKRCAFERAMAKGEFERGDKARIYAYTVVKEGDIYRVARCVDHAGLTVRYPNGAPMFAPDGMMLDD